MFSKERREKENQRFPSALWTGEQETPMKVNHWKVETCLLGTLGCKLFRRLAAERGSERAREASVETKASLSNSTLLHVLNVRGSPRGLGRSRPWLRQFLFATCNQRAGGGVQGVVE